eukprot:gene18720-24483_t
MSIFNEGSTIDSASSRNSSSIDNKDVNETASIYIIESLKSTFESQKTTNTILVSEKPSNENVIESSRDIDVASSDERGTIFEKIDDKVDIQNCNDFFVIDTVKTVINKNDDVIRKNDEDIQKNDEEMVSNFLPMDIESDFPRRDSLLTSINSSKDDEESIDSLQADESRNNLYWVSSPHNFACVWYGDPNLESSESLVDVHRIVLEKETSKNIVRSNLQPLDDKILNSTTDINPDLKDFLIALLEFSEWDDGLRGSYEWPDFIRNFAFDSQKLLVWLNNTISVNTLGLLMNILTIA